MLRPDGRFAWNVFVFDHHLAVQNDGPPGGPAPHTFHNSVHDNRMDIVREDGARSSLWWGTKNEWLGLLHVAGFEVEAAHATGRTRPRV